MAASALPSSRHPTTATAWATREPSSRCGETTWLPSSRRTRPCRTRTSNPWHTRTRCSAFSANFVENQHLSARSSHSIKKRNERLVFAILHRKYDSYAILDCVGETVFFWHTTYGERLQAARVLLSKREIKFRKIKILNLHSELVSVSP